MSELASNKNIRATARTSADGGGGQDYGLVCSEPRGGEEK